MKNLWILNNYAQVPGGSGGTRHFSLAKHLQSQGWNTSIIAASIELFTGRQRLELGEKNRIENFEGIPFCWVRSTQYEGNGFGRMVNMLTYSVRVLFPSILGGLKKPDVIIGSSVHPFAAWSAAVLAKRFNVPFVFEVRDLWPQTLIDLGRLNSDSIVARLMRCLEKWLYKKADRIVVVLPKAHEYIVPLGISSEKIEYIPNGVEINDFPRQMPPQGTDEFILMYFGAHDLANGLECVLKAMAELKGKVLSKKIQLKLVGDGPLKKELQVLAEGLALENVEFSYPVPKSEVPFLASKADAFVFNLIDAPVFKYGISSNKLFDFLAASRPIIFSCDASNNPVEEAGAGITVAPGKPEALAAAIKEIVEMSYEKRVQKGSSGREYVEKFHSCEALASRLSIVLDEVILEHARN